MNQWHTAEIFGRQSVDAHESCRVVARNRSGCAKLTNSCRFQDTGRRRAKQDLSSREAFKNHHRSRAMRALPSGVTTVFRRGCYSL